MTPAYITAPEAAEIMHLTRGQVQKLCKANRLPGAYQIGRGGVWLIPRASAEQYVPRPVGQPRKDTPGKMTAPGEVCGGVHSPHPGEVKACGRPAYAYWAGVPYCEECYAAQRRWSAAMRKRMP